MSNASDFIIENGVLKKYVGPGGDVLIPEGVTKIYQFWVLDKSIEESITRIVVPESVTEILDETFKDFRNLEEVILPEGLKDLGYSPFSNCVNLRQVNYPKSIKKLNGSVFGPWEVTGIAENKNFLLVDNFLLNKKGTHLIAYLPKAEVRCARIPEGITNIPTWAFVNTVLDELWIPEGVTTIGCDAFSNHKIRFIHLPKSVVKLAKDFANALYQDDDGWDGRVYVSFYDAELMKKRFGEGYIMPVYLGGDIRDLPVKERRYAAEGFAYAIRHGVEEIEQYRQSYVDFIRDNMKTYVKAAKENEDILYLLMEENLLEQKEAEKVLKALKDAPVDVKTTLMAYIRKLSAQSDPFVLDAGDRDASRRAKMQRRREEIQNQQGIQGITFVVTGELNHFGSPNEWTPGIDYSDLKEYIEKRGGFLRSAISGKTDYLICNDPASTTTKMEEARELEIPIISEAEFLAMSNQ